jgi:hypothetical protein
MLIRRIDDNKAVGIKVESFTAGTKGIVMGVKIGRESKLFSRLARGAHFQRTIDELY